MAEAVRIRGRDEYQITSLAAAAVIGEVYQLPNGQAAVYGGLTGTAAGDAARFCTEGQFRVTKKAGEAWIDGDPIWWDRSAGNATCLEPVGAADRDFFLGSAVGDAADAATAGVVNFNVEPCWLIDSTRDNGDTILVMTAGTPDVKQVGGMLRGNFSVTAEAQKFDWLSDIGFAVAANWVAEILLEIFTAPNTAAVDIDMGVASATHASDFEAVAEFAAFHLDGDDVNIDAHSDDGTTDIAPTDTTVDWVAGTPVRLKLDGRDHTNVKYYVEGDEVLSGTANLGNLTAAAGPLKAIIHAEKGADASPLVLKARIRVRTMEQALSG